MGRFHLRWLSPVAVIASSPLVLTPAVHAQTTPQTVVQLNPAFQDVYVNFPAQFTVTYTGGTDGAVVVMQFGDGAIAQATASGSTATFSHTYGVDGAYQATAQVFTGGCLAPCTASATVLSAFQHCWTVVGGICLDAPPLLPAVSLPRLSGLPAAAIGSSAIPQTTVTLNPAVGWTYINQQSNFMVTYSGGGDGAQVVMQFGDGTIGQAVASAGMATFPHFYAPGVYHPSAQVFTSGCLAPCTALAVLISELDPLCLFSPVVDGCVSFQSVCLTSPVQRCIQPGPSLEAGDARSRMRPW